MQYLYKGRLLARPVAIIPMPFVLTLPPTLSIWEKQKLPLLGQWMMSNE
jgi:hypothetical protein